MNEWDVIVAHGTDEALRAFILGFVAGRGATRDAVRFGRDLPLEQRSLGERLRALLPGGRNEAIILVDAHVAGALAAALREASDLGIALAEHARLIAVSFTFTAETPSRDAAAHVIDVVEHPPAGVTVVDLEREVIDPNARGIERYAPVHEYMFRATGRITGSLDGVLAMHDRLKQTDFVAVQDLRLEERPIGRS
jgi:hypothetical protein